MPNRVFYVRYSNGRWLFGREEQAFEVFDKKKSAVERGLAVMSQTGDVELVVLRKDGRVEKRYP